ncbi:hypothetical protein ABTX80_18445 [Streptomyces erythrochromogenes]|uniref:hypothetical protein n=1 Tax=Streptomyces erythrochromogenes TaxID=285574 RepID=UPI00331CD8E6
MQLRRVLPLTLAALVMASGCVTVHPAPARAPDAPQPDTAGHRGMDHGVRREPTHAAGPLVLLPSATAAEPASDPGEPAPPPASAPHPPPAAPERPAPQVRRPRGAEPPRASKPVKAAGPKARAKARRQPAAPAKSRPAPGRSYDMAPLCEAAKGTVSPAIVALCR